MGRLILAGFADDLDRFSGGQNGVHAGGANTDPLLAAAHPQTVELRPVQQLAEDQRDLLFEDAGAVVLDRGLVPAFAGLFDMDPNFRQDARLFARIEGVVDRLLDGGQKRLAGVIETQHVAVLGKELAHRDFALLLGHRLGGGTARCGFLFHGSIGGGSSGAFRQSWGLLRDYFLLGPHIRVGSAVRTKTKAA